MKIEVVATILSQAFFFALPAPIKSVRCKRRLVFLEMRLRVQTEANQRQVKDLGADRPLMARWDNW